MRPSTVAKCLSVFANSSAFHLSTGDPLKRRYKAPFLTWVICGDLFPNVTMQIFGALCFSKFAIIPVL